MDIDALREYLLSKPYVSEYMPFGPDTLVFKVGSKVFALVGLDAIPLRINLKCDPDRAEEFRENYAWIIPGFHMNKKHWNTLILDFQAPNRLVKELIDHSYDLVFASLTKKERLVLRG
jgi:predicted DNA-binding protein (MmcQ/YjbR family)